MIAGCHDLVAVLLHEGNTEESARTTVPIASGRVLDGPPRRSTDTSIVLLLSQSHYLAEM